MKIELRAFTANDWMGFAGAESFAEGEPLYGELTHEGVDYVLIADKSGISLMSVDATEGKESQWEYLWPKEPADEFHAEFGVALVPAPWEHSAGWMRLG
jgi:hypothetical protein